MAVEESGVAGSELDYAQLTLENGVDAATLAPLGSPSQELIFSLIEMNKALARQLHEELLKCADVMSRRKPTQ